MTLAQFPEIKKMTSRQKIRLANEIWLDAMSDEMPVPAAHKKTLDSRWADYKAGKVKTISLEEMKRWLDRK